LSGYFRMSLTGQNDVSHNSWIHPIAIEPKWRKVSRFKLVAETRKWKIEIWEELYKSMKAKFLISTFCEL